MPDQTTEKAGDQISVDIRMCKDCRATVFGKRDFADVLSQKPPDVRAYENLVQFEGGIRSILPRFQRLLMALQYVHINVLNSGTLTDFRDPDKPPSPAQLAEAARLRKRLTDSFTQYNSAARRLRDLPTQSPTQQKLQRAIFHQATSFLHIHMLPLRSLPQVLKHASANGTSSPAKNANGKPNGALAAIKYNDVDAASQASSSSAVSALEAEEKTLREQLIVLEEQAFLVKEQITDASKRRKFDEVNSLSQNMDDLNREINQVQGQLGQLDFAGAYNGKGPQSPTAR